MFRFLSSSAFLSKILFTIRSKFLSVFLSASKYLSIVLIIFSFVFQAQAKAKSDLLSKSILKDMTLTYSQVEYMKSTYTKKQISDLLGETEESSGDLEFSKGRLRVEEKNKSKNRNIFIKNKENFWHLQPDHQVLTGSVKESIPSVFEMMFSNPDVWDGLDSKVIEDKDGAVTIKVQMGKDKPGFSNFEVTINKVKRRFETISFEDELGNKTEIAFDDTQFLKKAKEKRFKYKTKRKDKVTYL